MAIPIEVQDMARQVLGREASQSEISGGAGKSVGELADWLRSGVGVSSGGGFSGGGGGGGGDFLNQAQDMLRQSQETLSSGVAGAKDSITSQYDNLLNEVTKTTRGELGQRGIPLSSTFAQQEETGAKVPVESARSSALANIPFQQAQAQSGLIGNALNLYGAQQQAQQADLARQQWEFQKPYIEQQYQYDLNRPYFKPDTASGGGGLTALDFLQGLGGNSAQQPQAQPAAQLAYSPPPQQDSSFLNYAGGWNDGDWDKFGLGGGSNISYTGF